MRCRQLGFRQFGDTLYLSKICAELYEFCKESGIFLVNSAFNLFITQTSIIFTSGSPQYRCCYRFTIFKIPHETIILTVRHLYGSAFWQSRRVRIIQSICRSNPRFQSQAAKSLPFYCRCQPRDANGLRTRLR